jgi:hypothetical protein
MVYALTAALGLVASVDNPTRPTFVLEMVDRDNLTSAVSVNAVMAILRAFWARPPPGPSSSRWGSARVF